MEFVLTMVVFWSGRLGRRELVGIFGGLTIDDLILWVRVMEREEKLENVDSFPRTRWTLVRSLVGSGGEGVERVGRNWEAFHDEYWAVLVSWLRKRGAGEADAKDLVQTLILKLWQSEHFPSCLSAEKGRLRSFLIAALKNTWEDARIRQSRQKRGGGVCHVDLTGFERGGEADDLDFDRDWAVATVMRARQNLRMEYAVRGQGEFFDEGMQLLASDDPGLRNRVEDQLDLKSNTLSVALKRLRDRLVQRIRDEVEATLFEPSEEEVRQELGYLLKAFSRAGGEMILLRKQSPPEEKGVGQGDGE